MKKRKLIPKNKDGNVFWDHHTPYGTIFEKKELGNNGYYYDENGNKHPILFDDYIKASQYYKKKVDDEFKKSSWWAQNITGYGDFQEKALKKYYKDIIKLAESYKYSREHPELRKELLGDLSKFKVNLLDFLKW